MNKQCKACGSNVPDDAKFCQACGGSDFIINNQISNQSSYNQPWQPPVPQSKPKKRKTGLIIGIIAVVLILLAVIGMVAEKMFQKQVYGDDVGDNGNFNYNVSGETNNNTENNTEKSYYSKGSFDGSVYINKWADIQLALPEGFSNADLATYNAAENSNTECGLYFVADDTMSLIYISYEKLPKFPVYDEEKYLDAAMKSLGSASGVTYKTPDTYSSTTIAGYTYAKAECKFNNGNGVFSNTFYVRKLDNYMICISTIGIDSGANDALASKITVVK